MKKLPINTSTNSFGRHSVSVLEASEDNELLIDELTDEARLLGIVESAWTTITAKLTFQNGFVKHISREISQKQTLNIDRIKFSQTYLSNWAKFKCLLNSRVFPNATFSCENHLEVRARQTVTSALLQLSWMEGEIGEFIGIPQADFFWLITRCLQYHRFYQT